MASLSTSIETQLILSRIFPVAQLVLQFEAVLVLPILLPSIVAASVFSVSDLDSLKNSLATFDASVMSDQIHFLLSSSANLSDVSMPNPLTFTTS